MNVAEAAERMLTPDRLRELRRIAEAAVQGDWFICHPNCRQVWVRDDGPLGGWCVAICDTQESGEGFTPEAMDANARHIATFDPPTVLALLDEIERLRNVAIDPGEYGIDEPVVDWKRTAELRAQVIERLRREISVQQTTLENLRSALVAEGHEPGCPVVWGYSVDCVPGTCIETRTYRATYGEKGGGDDE